MQNLRTKIDRTARKEELIEIRKEIKEKVIKED